MLIFRAARFDDHSPEVIEDEIIQYCQANCNPHEPHLRTQAQFDQRANHNYKCVEVKSYQGIQAKAEGNAKKIKAASHDPLWIITVVF